MPRSRGRRKQQPPKPPPPLPPSPALTSLPKRFLRWLLATRLHQIEFGVSLLVGTVVIAGWIYDALREPEIHPSTAQLEKPFLLPFSLHNPSWFFAMRGTTFLCVIYNVTVQGGGGAKYLSVTEGSAPVDIPPRATRQYICPFDRALALFANVPKLKAEVAIMSRYKTLGIDRDPTSDHFTWSASTGQWTEGIPLN